MKVLLDQAHLQLTVSDRIARLEVRRPDALNALTLQVLHGIGCACRIIDGLTIGGRDFTEVGVLLLSGAGEKAFVAGADIKAMREAPPAELSAFIWAGQQAMRSLELLPLPVIAVVQGFALGGGFELALAADIIIAAENAKFGQPEVNLGLIPGFGGTQRLAAKAGSGIAKRLTFTAETISATEAKALGLVEYVVPATELATTVSEVTKVLLGKSPIALAAAKRAIERYFAPQKLAGLTIEVEEFLGLFSAEDAKAGLSAFIEKRPPTFPGKM